DLDMGKQGKSASDAAKAQLSKLIGRTTCVVAAATKKSSAQSETDKKVKLLGALLDRLMEVNPASRFSAAEAVSHELLQVAAARLCAEEEAVHGMMHPGRVLLGGTPVYGGEGQYFPIAVRTVAQAVDPAAVEAEMLRFYDSRVLKIQAEAGDADHAPIDGNLYSYLALRVFGETSGLFQVKDAEKENPFLLSGLALVIVIQIVGPICVLAYAFPRALAMMDLSPELFLLRSEGNLHFLSTFTVTKLSQMLIGTLFIVLFILNGLYVLEEDRQTDKRLVHLCQVFRAASRRDPRIPEPCEGWLFVGALVNCWVLVTTALAMWPCFLIADQGPKEVLFDAFALTFLYNLDDISGDLGFLNDQWDSEMFGEVYGSLDFLHNHPGPPSGGARARVHRG
ncbi:unnamed protein product, partial [Prorocentrum cordatum]